MSMIMIRIRIKIKIKTTRSVPSPSTVFIKRNSLGTNTVLESNERNFMKCKLSTLNYY